MANAGTTMSGSSGQLQQAPAALLWGAAAALAVSIALLVPWSIWFSALGYLLAPLAVTGLVTTYTYQDIKASQSVWYAANPGRRQLGSLLIALGFGVGLVHAWVIATEIAKMSAA